jgi:tricarballylate dehydrogenase
MRQWADVVVVGGGNAGLCAAITAAENGADVVVLERAPEESRGGNTAFTGGVYRFPFDHQDEIVELLGDMTPEERAAVDFSSYAEREFYDDIARVTEFRADPELADLLVSKSNETVRWLHDLGLRFIPNYGRQSYVVDGVRKFWGGVPLEVSGAGLGIVDGLTRAAVSAGVDIHYGARATTLVHDDSGVHGVRGKGPAGSFEIAASAVVLAAGGFQANAEWRTKYLGPGWDLAKVRGTRYDTGDGLKMALDIGALSTGQWSGCHAVGWDLNAPTYGDLSVGDGFSKHNYNLGVLVNANGERFVDEGADIRNYTYAKYGRAILSQPGQFAWQIFDAKVSGLLRTDFYRVRHATRRTADSLEELVQKLDGVDAEACLKTLEAYNASIDTSVPFDPTRKDGLTTSGVAPAKSNWANRLDEPPFEAFAVTCGVTFTFGGIAVNTRGQVLDVDGDPIPHLYSCGEMVGGLFYFNYPSGTGLSWGAVLGREAGRAAAGERASEAAANA